MGRYLLIVFTCTVYSMGTYLRSFAASNVFVLPDYYVLHTFTYLKVSVQYALAPVQFTVNCCSVCTSTYYLLTFFRFICAVGAPIAVPKTENPSQQLVDEYHRKYVDALVALFEQHKGKYHANGEQAKLQIV